jgi:hypothetical protein
MPSGQEIGVEGRVMEQSLKDDSLITGLSHVPNAASATTGARVLVSVVLDIDLRSRVFNPTVLAIYQIVSWTQTMNIERDQKSIRHSPWYSNLPEGPQSLSKP